MTRSLRLNKLSTFHGREGPLLLVVADGVGVAEAGPANAVSLAHTPVMDELIASPHGTILQAHGTHVGLPTDADMGNSEVGHNTLGGGRVFDQGAKLVNSAFDTGSIFEGDCWKEVEDRGKRGKTVHFIGLLSDGNVHSHIDHLFHFLHHCRDTGIASVRVHILLDGRDVGPRTAPTYVEQLNGVLEEINSGGEFDYAIASGGGRMSITMDRYQADWDMVRRGYDIHVLGRTGEFGTEVADALEEIQRQYRENPDLSDQYLQPFVVVDSQGPVGRANDGDAVILFNFRGDRAIEISQSLEDPEFTGFNRDHFPDIFYCGMLQYDGDLNVPANYLVDPPAIDRTMGEYLCAEGLASFAVSETQKFGHVTYFWNGNRSGYIDPNLETYVEVPSDNCEFNQAPDMKAVEITDATIELLESGKYRFGRINFANGDMVGHTGDIAATVQGLETVDRCLGRLLETINKLGGLLIFTADHGNADEMFVEVDGKRVVRTSHSLNPVPFVIADPNDADYSYHINYAVDGGLANVAATVFNLLGYEAPEGYEQSLITIPGEAGRQPIYKGRVVDLGVETVRLPNDELMALEVVRHPGGSVVVAMDEDRRLCLIRQFRHAAGGWIWEFPAGILESDEPPLDAAQRELAEEAGLAAEHWVDMGSTLTSPGFCDERLYLFLATGLSAGDTAHEDHEFIEIHWLPVEVVTEMATNGDLDDAKSIVALHRALLKLDSV